MPKSYMIKRFRKKGGPTTGTKVNKNRNIPDLSTDITTKGSSTTLNQGKLNVSTSTNEEECAKQDLSSVPKLPQRATEEHTETIPLFENAFKRSLINPVLQYRHQTLSFPGASSTVDYQRQQHSMLPQFIDMFPLAQTAPLDFKLPSLIQCGIPDNISPKSATSAKESPTFPTDASVPTHWSPYSILPPIKTEIFNFDPKSPLTSSDHLSPIKTSGYHKCNGTEFGVSAKYTPEHLSVLPLDQRVVGHRLNVNYSTLCGRYDTKPCYFHADTNAAIAEKDPKGQIPTDKALAFSLEKNLPRINNPFNMFCNIPMCKSNTDVEQDAMHKPKSISSKRIELVNDGFGMTNPALEPLFINDDTVKAKQLNQICACQVCGLIFPKPKLLNRHITKTHDKIKKYLCTFCPKGFNDKFDLKRHTRTHTAIKPFKCDICEKGFSQRCSLEAHKRKVHSQEVEFKPKQRRDKIHICEECGSTTKDPNKHYFHIKLNHPNSALLSKFHDKRQFKSSDTKADGASIATLVK